MKTCSKLSRSFLPKTNKKRIKAAKALESFLETEEYDLAKQEQGAIHSEISEIKEELYKRTEKEN